MLKEVEQLLGNSFKKMYNPHFFDRKYKPIFFFCWHIWNEETDVCKLKL